MEREKLVTLDITALLQVQKLLYHGRFGSWKNVMFFMFLVS